MNFQIDYILLILVFFCPAVLLSDRIFKGENRILLLLITPIVGSFFWILSSIILPLNYLITNKYLGLAVIASTILLIFFQANKSEKYKNLFILSFSLYVCEMINENYGVIHNVATASYAIESAKLNLNMLYSRIPVPPLQVAGLKFMNNNVMLVTINQYIGFSLLLFNLEFISQYFKIKRGRLYLFVFPVFTIFCVLLEVASGRTHLVASQLLTLLFLLSLADSQHGTVLKNVYLLSVFLIITSRLESLLLYGPSLLLLSINYLAKTKVDIGKIFLVFCAGISINLLATSSIEDLRSSFLNIFIAMLFIMFLKYREDKIINKFITKINLLISLFIILIGFVAYSFYGSLALNSWASIITHLLDTHQNWIVSSLLLASMVVFSLSHTDDIFTQKFITQLSLVVLLILITSPFQHSIYGGGDWTNGLIEMPIYNPYDESQTRSILQVLLSLTPISALVLNKAKKDSPKQSN